jgi:hypothetical protein
MQGFVDSLESDHEARYELKVIKYLMTRYKVTPAVKGQVYDLAEATFGERRPTMAILEQVLELPLTLRTCSVPKPTEKLDLAKALNGKAVSGYLGNQYREVRSSFPDLVEMNYVIGMCFNYPYLKSPNSASSLVLHDGVPTMEEISTNPGIILCQGDLEMELWVIEPLRQLLDRLEAGTSQ